MKKNIIQSIMFAFLLLPVLAFAQQPVKSEMQVYVVAIDKNGKETLLEKEEAAPGQLLEYRLVYTNVSKKSVKIANAGALVPKNTDYVPGSASTKVKSRFTVSIDNGETYEKEPVIRTRKEQGKVVEYIVPESEYTNVRWEKLEKLKASAKQEFVYRVKVN